VKVLQVFFIAAIFANMTFLQLHAEELKALPGAEKLPLSLFSVPEDLEISIWANTPNLYNPACMSTDAKGRIWVAEGVNYRNSVRNSEGDRIVILEDADGDGKADRSKIFYQSPELATPMALCVIGNKIYLDFRSKVILITDKNYNDRYDPEFDSKEILFDSIKKEGDHSMHGISPGPDGYIYWNHGNFGADIKTKEGVEYKLGSFYRKVHLSGHKSSDGHVYIGGAMYRMLPDGSHLSIIAHNFRNSYEQVVNSYGDIFQNDNDAPPNCRVSYVPERANFGFASRNGLNSFDKDLRPGQSRASAHWRQDDPWTTPSGDVYGMGSPTGIEFYENGALPESYIGSLFSCEPNWNEVFNYQAKRDGAGFNLKRGTLVTSNLKAEFSILKRKDVVAHLNGDLNIVEATAKGALFRPSDITVGADGALYIADWYDQRVGGHKTYDKSCSGAIYRIAPKGFKTKKIKVNVSSVSGAIDALKNPSANIRFMGHWALRGLGQQAIAPLKNY
jgi:putative membrane-bound dehydrogenase-like protein